LAALTRSAPLIDHTIHTTYLPWTSVARPLDWAYITYKPLFFFVLSQPLFRTLFLDPIPRFSPPPFFVLPPPPPHWLACAPHGLGRKSVILVTFIRFSSSSALRSSAQVAQFSPYPASFSCRCLPDPSRHFPAVSRGQRRGDAADFLSLLFVPPTCTIQTLPP